MHNKKVLTIDPGTRNMGIAVFRGKKLSYYGVHTFPRLISKKILPSVYRGKLIQLVLDFHPDLIVYEKTFFKNNPTSKGVNTLTRQIQLVGKINKIEVIGISPTTVRKLLCGNGNSTKRDVATILVSRFPELSPYLIKDKKWKEDFHLNMFDAIALGCVIDEFQTKLEK